jgi:translocation and assembly module TamA
LKRLRFLLCLSALTAFHAGQAARAAGDEAAGDASADAEGTPSAGAGTLALDAPALSQPVRDMLARHARSLQLREPLTDERSRRRALRRIRREVSDLLATEGYFTPQFDIAGDPPSLRIEPGAQAVIGGVAIEFDGDLASDTPAHAERREALRMSWRLSVGKPFRQSDWSAAKQALLDDLQARDYAAGSLAGSRAEVDPEAAKVALQVRLDSGPAFRFGDIEAVGLALHDLDLVRRYSSLRPGDPYSVDALLAFERSLQASPYFSSAQISVDRDPARAAATPVTVSVAESSPKKLSFSAGLSSNTGYRGEVGWSQNNLFDRSWLLTSAVRLEQLRQIAFADIMLPPATDGYRDSFGVLAESADIQDLITRRVGVGAVRARVRGDIEIRHSLSLQREQREIDGLVTSTQQSLALNTSWTWRRVDDLFNPRDGWVLNAQVGGGLKGVLSDTNFVRGYLKGQWFLPIGARDQLILRGEAGLTAGAAESLPQDFLFRTGGSTSVRGYDYLALGVRQGSAIVGGRVLGVASVEYVHWMSAQWGAAFFVDAGDAADSRKDFDTAYGAGAGVRWRSPAGPIAFDIAYGEREKTWRPHFSLAIAF